MAKSSKSANGSHEMAPVPSHVGQVLEDPSVTHDAVFGEITADGPNYRSVSTPLSYDCPFERYVVLTTSRSGG